MRARRSSSWRGGVRWWNRRCLYLVRRWWSASSTALRVPVGAWGVWNGSVVVGGWGRPVLVGVAHCWALRNQAPLFGPLVV
jgi:hypothetical protein